MSVKGKLTKEMMGSNLPVDMPAVNSAAGFFKEVRMLRFDYITDSEIVARVIPSQLSLKDDATAAFMVIEYGFTFVGPYKEAILSVNVLHQDVPYVYFVQLMLNSALPTMAGRDTGYPKKVGFVDITQHEDTIAGYVERPKGERLATGILRIDQPIEPYPEEMPGSSVLLRPVVYPDKPVQMELIRMDTVLKPTKVYAATGSCSFTGISVVDPWHTIPVKKMVGVSYIEGELYYTSGETLETF
ncbi:MAG: acetoacetate decarboxylase family protein [Deltaproteobacteria bacterium]|nr:acetoacetate decarboxylase family protein [Deltaproteobacteria bacterium]